MLNKLKNFIKGNMMLFIALLLLIVFMIWRKISKLIDVNKPVNEQTKNIVNQSAQKQVAKQTKKIATAVDVYSKKTPYSQIEFSNWASQIALFLGTHKSLNWFERNLSAENEEEILNILKPLTKYAVSYISNYYTREHTENRDLVTDLQKYLSPSEYNSISSKLSL